MIEALCIPPRLMREAVRDILVESATDGARGALKAQVTADTGVYFQALPACSKALGLASVKWAAVGVQAPGWPSVAATILLSDTHTGDVVAALDGGWITRARTGAMTAIAAEALAPPDSRCIGFVGAGAQAKSHLLALREVLPGLRSVSIYDRSPRSAEALLSLAVEHGLDARVVSSPECAVRDQDVVVSSVPASGVEAPMLDVGWLPESSFVSMVDLGRSWRPASFDALDIVATDDLAHSEALARAGKMAFQGPYDFTLADFARGARPVAQGRSALIFGGIGLADLAGAALVLRTLKGA